MHNRFGIAEKAFSSMSNLRMNIHIKLDFREVDQYGGGKWLIQSFKYHKDKHMRFSIEPAYSRKCQDYVYIKWEYWSTM